MAVRCCSPSDVPVEGRWARSVRPSRSSTSSTSAGSAWRREAEGERRVLPHGQLLHQPERLRARWPARTSGPSRSRPPDLTGVGRLPPAHQVEQRRLAGARRPDQPDQLARVHGRPTRPPARGPSRTRGGSASTPRRAPRRSPAGRFRPRASTGRGRARPRGRPAPAAAGSWVAKTTHVPRAASRPTESRSRARPRGPARRSARRPAARADRRSRPSRRRGAAARRPRAARGGGRRRLGQAEVLQQVRPPRSESYATAQPGRHPQVLGHVEVGEQVGGRDAGTRSRCDAGAPAGAPGNPCARSRWPATTIVPEVGRSWPASARRNDDFPLPVGPTRACTTPGSERGATRR